VKWGNIIIEIQQYEEKKQGKENTTGNGDYKQFGMLLPLPLLILPWLLLLLLVSIVVVWLQALLQALLQGLRLLLWLLLQRLLLLGPQRPRLVEA
jgi:hypothetical protein